MAKSCNYGGGWCPNFAIEGGAGYCEDHASKQKATRASLQSHYQHQHKVLRIKAFIRDGWTCVRCGWKPRCVREWENFQERLNFPPQEVILAELTRAYKRGENHLQGDHILDVETHPELANVLSNMQALCKNCHSLKTGKART